MGKVIVVDNLNIFPYVRLVVISYVNKKGVEILI